MLAPSANLARVQMFSMPVSELRHRLEIRDRMADDEGGRPIQATDGVCSKHLFGHGRVAGGDISA